MKFEIINTKNELNVIGLRYFLLGTAIVFIIFKFYVNYKDYKTYLHHKVEVFYNSGKNPYPGTAYKPGDFYLWNIVIPNGELDVKPQDTYTIKAKSYFQYFILDFNPNNKTWFTFYFLFHYMIISSILFFALRKSNKDRIFTKELLTGLTYLSCYLIIMIVMKIFQLSLFEDYVEKISNQQVIFHSINTADVVNFQLFSLIFIFIISFVKQGLKLQQEQDLTV